MTDKSALITGITGQDGSLLADYLLSQGYKIIAPTRKLPNKKNLIQLDIDQNKNINFCQYDNWEDFSFLIKQYTPDEIYHLGAISHVGESHQNPSQVMDVNIQWTLQILNAMNNYSQDSRLFFASSCEIFHSDLNEKVHENSQKSPTNPYGISKLTAHQLIEYYRNIKNIHACNGILFNHESELRNENFVSKKICKTVAHIVKYGNKTLSLGNIDAKKDWGYAPDFVQIFHQILQLDKAQDFVIATGVLHSVKDMVIAAFNALNYPIYWQGAGLNCQAKNNKGLVVVDINKKYFRSLDDRYLIGDTTKLSHAIPLNPFKIFDKWVEDITIKEYKKLT